MAHIDASTQVHTRVTTLTVSPETAIGLAQTLARSTAERAGTVDGLISSTWLASRSGPGPEGPARLVHHTQWIDAQLGTAGAGELLSLDGVGELVAPTRVDTYELRHLACTDAGSRLVLAAGPATFLITMDAHPGRQEELVRRNVADTDALFATFDGFVAAGVFAAHEGSRVFEVVQWQSAGHFFAAAADPRFREHVSALSEMCHATDAAPYDVLSVDASS